ncbi:MAG: lysylphosphatidylglycerol synthase transmembrane domain-containing protein [Halieaceae bacterium]|nr:lysylphosphatidylglycerol synthase transmembrane domain-containing protein [Halieaceae bacterium]
MVTVKGLVVFLLKLLVSGACLYWVLSTADMDALVSAAASIGVAVLLVAVLLHVVSYLAGGLRWWLILRALGADVSFNAVLPSYYMGVFFNNFLPSGFGGDVARSVQLYTRGISGVALVASAILDRLVGFVSVILLGFVTAVTWPVNALGNLPLLVFGFSMLALAPGILLAFRPRAAQALGDRLSPHFPRTAAVVHRLPLLAAHRLLLVQSVGLSMLNQLLVVAVIWSCARAMGIGIDFAVATILVFLAFLTTALPISVGGLGVREGALVALLGKMGYAAGLSVALSLVYVAILWMTAIPGAMVWLLQSRKPNPGRSANG